MKIGHALAVATMALGHLSIPVTASAQAQASPDPARLALAGEIVDTAFPEADRFEMFSKVSDQVEAQMTQSVGELLDDAGAMDIIERHQAEVRLQQADVLARHIPLLMDSMKMAYADLFSQSELEDILAFVSTDSGKSFMMRSSDVMTNPHFAEANQQYMNAVMAIAMAEMPKMVEELISYKESKTSD